MSAIRSDIKELDLNGLKKKEKQIISFLVDFPNNERSEQGWKTIDVVSELIDAIESGDNLKEWVLKNLFFE